MSDLIRVRHKISGRITEEPENIVNHFWFGQFLEEVGPDAKPYLPEMHRVNLPENPTEDQIKVALVAGAIDETEAAKLRKAATPTAPTDTAELEANRVALEEAHTKDKK